MNLAQTYGLPTEITHLISGLNETQVLDVSLQKEPVRNKMIVKKGVYLGRNTLHRQSVAISKERVATKYELVSSYGLGIVD